MLAAAVLARPSGGAQHLDGHFRQSVSQRISPPSRTSSACPGHFDLGPDLALNLAPPSIRNVLRSIPEELLPTWIFPSTRRKSSQKLCIGIDNQRLARATRICRGIVMGLPISSFAQPKKPVHLPTGKLVPSRSAKGLVLRLVQLIVSSPGDRRTNHGRGPAMQDRVQRAATVAPAQGEIGGR